MHTGSVLQQIFAFAGREIARGKMKTLLLLCAVSAVVSAAYGVELAPLYAMDSPTIVKGEYIVVLNEDVTKEEMSDHLSVVRGLIEHYPGNASEVMFEYNIGDFHGYSARMTDKVRDMVRSMGKVKYTEANQVVTATQDKCSLQKRATWGIVRTTIREHPEVEDYSYDANDGNGVDVYIIDTGIYLQHTDFGGRAIWGADFVNNPSPMTDLNGHGTHCAGTVMSNTWGLARRATAIAVRVLDANGSGTWAGVIAGVDYVAGQPKSRKRVANMSLGGGFDRAMNAAVDAAVQTGVHFSVAAGNDRRDACNYSPASAELPVSVGASDSSDQIASFSNYGTCVDIIGPGVSVTSTWNNGGTNTISGTSMAAPHIAGVMAKHLTNVDYTPAQLKALLEKEASLNMITGLTGSKSSTPNLLVFKGCE